MTDDLRRLAEAATPGPWRVEGWDDGMVVQNPNGDIIVDYSISTGDDKADVADAAYIVACSPDRILALLDRLDALEAVAVAARRFDGPCSPGEAVEGAVDIHNALAAIEGEK